jgi:hypothetical protein
MNFINDLYITSRALQILKKKRVTFISRLVADFKRKLPL